MQYYWDLIWHYLSSNSRHGTHSPFVYKMADEIIYRSNEFTRSDAKLSSEDRLIDELSSYLVKEKYLNVTKNKLHIFNIYDVSLEEVVQRCNDGDVFFLKGIFKNLEAKNKWSTISNNANIVVTIDLFYFGIVINRREQPKENFKLRFPYSKY